MIRRGLIALPDRLLLLVFWTTVVVALTTTAGMYRPVVVVPVLISVVAATWRLVPTPVEPSTRNLWTSITVLAGACGWALLNLPYAARALVASRDHGFLALSGVWLSGNASPDVPPGAALEVAERLSGTYVDSGALTLGGDTLHIQGSPVFPGLLALGGWLGGPEAVLAGNLALSAVALVAVFALARRLTGSVWALVPAVALATSLPMLAFARATYTEPVVVVLVLGGLVMAWSGLGERRTAHLVVGTAMVASAGLVRIDGSATLIGLLLGTSLAVASSTLPSVRGFLRRSYLLMLPAGGAAIGLGVLTLWLHSPGYLEEHGPQFRALTAALVAVVLVGVVLVLTPSTRLPQAVLRRRRAVGLVVGGLAALTAVVLITRPLWLVDRHLAAGSPIASVVEALQSRAGVPIDPTRSYDEQTVSWIAMYLGWPSVGLGLAGLAVMAATAISRRDPRLLVVVATIAAPTLLYLLRASITPDQVWAMRRFLPVTVPGLLVMATWLLSRTWAWVAGRRASLRDTELLAWALPARAGVAALGALVALAPLTTWGPIVRSVEYSGQLEQLRTVCSAVDDAGASRVVYVKSGLPYLMSLRLFCDVEVVEVRAEPTSRELMGIAEAWSGSGPIAVLTFSEDLVPWSEPPGAPVSSIYTEIWEQTLDRRPHSTTGWDQTIWIGTIRSDGRVEPVR